MWHGMNFYKRQKNFLELWTFSTSCENDKIHSLYLNTLPCFEEFIRYFSLKARSLVDVYDPSKLAKIELNQNNNGLQGTELCDLATITQKIKAPEVLLEGSQGIVGLTARENDCVKLLILGKSLKEIASCLGLSPRTVEFHVNQIKKKTGCYSKSKLIQLIQAP